MQAFVKARGLDQPERRVALAAGSPGVAMSLDIETVRQAPRRRCWRCCKVAAGAAPFSEWMRYSEDHRAQQERKAGVCI